MSDSSEKIWVDDEYLIACQKFLTRSELHADVSRAASSGVFLNAAIFLTLYAILRRFLKPLGLPFASQLLAGCILGPVCERYMEEYAVNRPLFALISSIMAIMGFYLQLFALGVQVSLRKLKKTGRNAFILSYSGFFTSLAFVYATYVSIKDSFDKGQNNSKVFLSVLFASASNYLLNTTSHLNDLGVGNSKLGQLASSTAMVADINIMLISIGWLNIIIPLFIRDPRTEKQVFVLVYYAFLFLVVRPLIMYIVSLKKEGEAMRRHHFVVIVLVILILSFVGEGVRQRFSTFLLALTLPEEPLSTVFAQKLDPFTNNVLFPFFVIRCGMHLQIRGYFDRDLTTMLIMGWIGKFLGVIFTAWFLRIPFSQGSAFALIMSTRGILDIASIDGLYQNNVITQHQYTILILHSIITIGVCLPLVKFLYEPSKQYSTIMRRGIFELQGNDEIILTILVCIHKEESLPELMRFLKVCYSTHQNPISILVLQLLQLTGRCAMPIMAPFHEVSSISTLRYNMDRSNRIVNAFLQLECQSRSKTRAQHFVAMSPYATMHNDICNLAYEKGVGLVILPFHVTWSTDNTIKDASVAIKGVNNMVLKKAPCSVGLLVDRSSSRKRFFVDDDDEGTFMISVVFIGGVDDYEALAYGRLFANHPSVWLNVIWLKAPEDNKDDNELDYELMKKFRRSCKNNERVTIQEVIVNNGAETVEFLSSIGDEVDLIVIGKYHDVQCIPLLGLLDGGWSEYPELGVLGDIFASDFMFSLLVIQQEVQEVSLDFEEEFFQ